MASFSEIMALQDDTVTSPDGGISARLINGGVREVRFSPGWYRTYTETALEEQIAALAKLVFVARRRARREALKQALGTEEEPRPRAPGSAKERLIRERANEASVEIKTGYLQVRVTAGTRWSMRIRQGTLAHVEEEDFVAELTQVVGQAIQEWKTKVQQLRSEIFGPGFETWAFIGKPLDERK